MTSFKSIIVGDLVHRGSRFWKVTTCLYGALGHEDVIGIVCMDRKPPCFEMDGVQEMFVPLDLIPQNGIFRAVDHEEEAKPKLVATA